MMVSIYTLTLSPSLDSATLTPQIYPEGKLRCSAPVFEPGGGGINVARAITHLGGKATAIFPQAVLPVNTWSPCWQMNRWP
jgi:6-phosphofructokinase 2